MKIAPASKKLRKKVEASRVWVWKIRGHRYMVEEPTWIQEPESMLGSK